MSLSAAVIVVSPAELAEIVRAAVVEALADHGPAVGARKPNPEALTSSEVCELYSFSKPHLHQLRKRGLPFYLVGDSPRFDRTAVHAWLTTARADD